MKMLIRSQEASYHYIHVNVHQEAAKSAYKPRDLKPKRQNMFIRFKMSEAKL